MKIDSKAMNKAYGDWLENKSPESENRLLTLLRDQAMNLMDDEDAAQNYVLGVWKELPHLKIKSNFGAWTYRRATFGKLGNRRNTQKRYNREQQPPICMNDDGNQCTDEDSLDNLAALSMEDDDYLDMESIGDPKVKELAEYLLQGYTQAEAASHMGIKLGTLKSHLSRWKHSKLTSKK